MDKQGVGYRLTVLGKRSDEVPPTAPTGLAGEFVPELKNELVELEWDRNLAAQAVTRYELMRAEDEPGWGGFSPPVDVKVDGMRPVVR